MAKYRPYIPKSTESELGLDEEFPKRNILAIEKIGNRINKDVRAASASFGILQIMDKATQRTGRLRRKADQLRDTTAYHAKRDLSSGDTYPLYPGVPPMGQRNVRQMRKAKPGIVPRPEGFE